MFVIGRFVRRVFAFRAMQWVCLFAFIGGGTALAGEREDAVQGLVSTKRKTIKASIKKLRELGDPAVGPVLEALRERRLRGDESGRVLIILDEEETRARDFLTGNTLTLDDGVELYTPVINNSVRRILSPTIAQLSLSSDDRDIRLKAAHELNKRPKPEARPSIEKALERETDSDIRELLALVLSQIELESSDPATRIGAIRAIGESGNVTLKAKLTSILEKDDDGAYLEEDAAVREAAEVAIDALAGRQAFIIHMGNLFYGISLGSVLLLAALGLAITFGLMGVINMAHGEMIMLGAYSTYVVQNFFAENFRDLFDYYLLAAIPVAFFVSALVGMLLERSVIRFLYGRPLETLLATWGISLVLIQSVRLTFGAQNVEVANPSWLSEGIPVAAGLVLTYNRIAIIVFAALVVLMVWLLMQRTSLGLQVRAVTQNRTMAACMGISTARVDMWTFGLGSGVAGLSGVALSQIGNVGPELGQSYIVDSFMVVVLGGVGNIMGSVAGGLGLGIINKFLEPVSGAVLGKIMVLVFIILFIQKRPQGIFALKGRTAEG